MCHRHNTSISYAMNTYHLEYAHTAILTSIFVSNDRVASDQDFHHKAHTRDALLTEVREDTE